MSLKGSAETRRGARATGPPRRRGQVLENALLDAAWAELCEKGYEGFTVEGVATRAATARTVIYRRWPTRPELLRAAVAHGVTRPDDV